MKILDLAFQGHSQTIAAFLLESAVGPILMETGPHSTLPTLEKQLATYGYTLPDIRHVFITHIHLDHAGAAWEFARQGATVYLHPLGKKHLANPEKLMASARMIYKDEMDSLWGDMQSIDVERLSIIQPFEKITLGNLEFTALHTPGHAVHHIAWQVGDVIFTGDVGGVKINNGIVVPPCPPPDINVEDWLSSIALLKSRKPAALYLTHFGRVDNVETHLNDLSAILRNWANWMLPYFEQQADNEAVTPLFQQYVANQLATAGIHGEDLVRYEGANPAWMSVAGLMRYWKKRTMDGGRGTGDGGLRVL
jgi:glyoxylase-like metal-dependent hydrolase (beta-lactamase superfamily II)